MPYAVSIPYAVGMSLVYPSSSITPAAYTSHWRAGALGPDLEVFRRSQGFTTAELARWLDMDSAGLAELAAAARPDPLSLSFHNQCALVARTHACDAFALRTLLRWVYGDR